MAVVTLPSRKPVRTRAIKVSTPPSAKSTQQSSPRRLEPTTFPARLQEVEEQLVSNAMERHPGRDRAVTHLLKDIEKPAGMTGSVARVTPPYDPSQTERIEDLLLEAIIRTHPNRGAAIVRLLGDVVGDAAIDETEAHATCEESDLTFDNDFDGMS